MPPKNLDDEDEDPEDPEFVSNSYYRALEQKIATLRHERKVLIRHRKEYQRKMNEAKNELNRLRKPPLLIGTLVEIVNDDQVVIKQPSGQQYIVQITRDINRETLVPGVQVAINQRTFTVVMTLSPEQQEGISKEDTTREKLENLERLLRNSKSLELDVMAEILYGSWEEKSRLIKWLLSLPGDHGFTVNGNILEIDREKVDRNIDQIVANFKAREEIVYGKVEKHWGI